MAPLDLAPQQRAHGLRRRALHSFSLSLARHPALVAAAWQLIRDRRGRPERIAAIFAFVQRLAARNPLIGGGGAKGAGPCAWLPEPLEDGLREGDVAAALLTAMLRAAGERASVEYTREMALVRVAVGVADVARLPPWARPVRSAAGRLDLALAPRGRWAPAGFLPLPVRAALQDRRSAVAVAS